LSIFDQIVSFSGRNITYNDVIANLNVLDYEYYFRITGAAIAGDVTSVLLTFNEILNKGFDGYNFMAGLNNHLRDLLVSRDETTVKLLETSPSIRQRYREQSVIAPLSFIYEALEIGSQCMLTFKSSKNQRLHVELALLRMCHTGSERTGEEAKKKAEQQAADDELVIMSSPVTATKGNDAKPNTAPGAARQLKAVQETDTEKKISIKNVISEPKQEESVVSEPLPDSSAKTMMNDFSAAELTDAWNSFATEIKEESPRISITLSSVTPELLPDRTVILKLDNSALKEAFDHNFRARLEHYLRDTLQNSIITLQTVVEATERGEILYSPEQKFNHLASKNPALKDLKKTFNLDFE
jgi:DNA polymerase-3 subunit gamma/tau